MSKKKNITKKRSYIPGIIRNDFGRKLTALIFAFLIYGYVFYFKVGIETKFQGVILKPSLPPQLVNLDTTPYKATITVRGSERRLKRLTPADFAIKVEVNEKNIIPGQPYPIEITPQDVSGPLGITIVDVTPNGFLLSLDTKITRAVDVKSIFSLGSSPPEGYAVADVTVEPAQVNLTGPSRIISLFKTVETEPVPLDKSTIVSFDYQASIDTKYKSISATPRRVNVEVQIVKASETVTFKAIPIQLLAASGNATLYAEIVSTPNADITVSGLKTSVEFMKNEQIKPFIDVSQFEEPGVYNVHVGCYLQTDDTNVRVKTIYPETVQVKLTRQAGME